MNSVNYTVASHVKPVFFILWWKTNGYDSSSCKFSLNLSPQKKRIHICVNSYFEKVHATIPEGTVGGFEFTVILRNLKELHERPWTYVRECY